MSNTGTGTLGNVYTGNGAGVAPSFKAFTAAPITWTNESGNFNVASNNGYIATAALTATMPASPTNGDIVNIIVDTTGSVVITANTGQKIRIAGSISSTAGTATSTARGNAVSLVYDSTGTTWVALSSITTWTLA